MHEFCPQRTRHVSLCEALDRLLEHRRRGPRRSDALGGRRGPDLPGPATGGHFHRKRPGNCPGRRRAATWPGSARRPAANANRGNASQPGSKANRPAALCRRPRRAGPARFLPSPPGEKTELDCQRHPADSNRKKNGLGQLVLTLMKVLHELLKRQALRRIEGGALSPAQMERLGVTLMNQAQEIERLRKELGLPDGRPEPRPRPAGQTPLNHYDHCNDTSNIPPVAPRWPTCSNGSWTKALSSPATSR